MPTTNPQTTGTSIAGLLGIAFVVLKLTGIIAWPWLWVLAPFWIGLAIGLFVIAIVALIVLVGALTS